MSFCIYKIQRVEPDDGCVCFVVGDGGFHFIKYDPNMLDLYDNFEEAQEAKNNYEQRNSDSLRFAPPVY